MNITTKLTTRFNQLKEVAEKPEGKSIIQQLMEVARLKYSDTHLSLSNYAYLGLGDQKAYATADLKEFGGSYMKKHLHGLLNSPHWDAVVTDKLVLSSVLESCGIPSPKIYAAACRFKRKFGELPVFDSKKDLEVFLESSIPYPFFCKPIKGGSAKGCMRAESFSRETNKILLADGESITAATFIDRLEDPTGWGYLFQEAVVSNPSTQDLSGDSVTGCRVIALLDDNQPSIFRIVWKIPAQGNYVDNFVGGTTGNLLADVDVKNGKVTRIVSGAGKHLTVNPEKIVNNYHILGRQLPDWESLKELIRLAAPSFPGFRFQHWDIGFSNNGPIAYELNTAGDLDITELARGKGAYDDELKSFIAKFNNQAKRNYLASGTPVNS
ncbi:hypothetical protein NBRC116494_36500 [Aurantivibrio plasticivorans]